VNRRLNCHLRKVLQRERQLWRWTCKAEVGLEGDWDVLVLDGIFEFVNEEPKGHFLQFPLHIT
jgi:hypothetical protein